MSKRWLWIGGVTFFLIVVFCIGFIVSYRLIQNKQAELPGSTGSLINKPLPPAQLIDLNGSKVDEQILRRGKVILIFVTTDCNACLTESRFLQTILERRTDVSFYGLIPFGKTPDTTQAAEKMFPFRVFYDEGNSYVRSMGINRVPVKVFLEDGIIKRGWIGAAMTDQSKRSFVEWFDSLP